MFNAELFVWLIDILEIVKLKVIFEILFCGVMLIDVELVCVVKLVVLLVMLLTVVFVRDVTFVLNVPFVIFVTTITIDIYTQEPFCIQ
jgi:hypothetical protein